MNNVIVLFMTNYDKYNSRGHYLPAHAYHPNALLMTQRRPYIARPDRK